MNALPPRVILYIPTRTFPKGFVHMETTFSDAWTLTRVTEPLSCSIITPAVSKGTFLCSIHVKAHSGTIMKRVKAHPDIIVTDLNGVAIPVISLTHHMSVFTADSLKGNLVFSLEPVPKPRPQGSLSSHVAKLLFDLAVLRKEQCPITMEDFTVGNTAAMPCGHLFLQMAIAESFKKEPYKCPWCRQKGVPTCV